MQQAKLTLPFPPNILQILHTKTLRLNMDRRVMFSQPTWIKEQTFAEFARFCDRNCELVDYI